MATTRLPSFAVVIPMYNEEAGALRCVDQIVRALDVLPNRAVLVVVEDGSTDRTRSILAGIGVRYPLLHVVEHDRNLGYGAALRTGITAAVSLSAEYVVFMDSDLTNDPADLRLFAEEMARGTDVIKASRYVAGGGVIGVPMGRRLVSFWGNLIGRVLFGVGIRDCTNGFRAVRTCVLARLELHENRFEVIAEELYNCKFVARSFAEVPVVLGNRRNDQRTTAFSYQPSTFWRYLRYAVLSFLQIRPVPIERKEGRVPD